MDTLVTFLLAVALTLFFVRSYLKKLTENKGRPAAPAAAHRTRACPSCAKAMESAAAFCSACGSPMKATTTPAVAAQGAR